MSESAAFLDTPLPGRGSWPPHGNLAGYRCPPLCGHSCCTGRATAHIKGMRFDKGDHRIVVQWYERAHGDEERLVFRKEEECVGIVNSIKLNHAITDASAILLRTRRGWAAVVAGWTAKRKPKRAAGVVPLKACVALLRPNSFNS